MTLKEFRDLTKDVPDSAVISYHAYYKGAALYGYTAKDIWFYPKDSTKPTERVVMNPGVDYDHRATGEQLAP